MKVILVAHGKFATELHNSLQMIVGEVSHFFPVNFYPDDGPDQLRERIETVLEINSGEQYIVFTDLYGGTLFNVSSRMAAEDSNISDVSGMNLPMLLELAFSVEASREELVEQAMNNAREGVKLFEYVAPSHEDSADSEEDEF